MLTFPGDHDVFASIPCHIDGSQSDSEGTDALSWFANQDEEAVREVPEDHDDEPSSLTEALSRRLPCANTRLCLSRIVNQEMTHQQLGDLLGIHRGNVGRLVNRQLQRLRCDDELASLVAARAQQS